MRVLLDAAHKYHFEGCCAAAAHWNGHLSCRAALLEHSDLGCHKHTAQAIRPRSIRAHWAGIRVNIGLSEAAHTMLARLLESTGSPC